jgi:ketosteroid isomerase-like protein
VQAWERAAREAIRDAVASYADAGDRFRLDELAALFSDDGVLEVKGMWSAAGRAAIVERLSSRRASDPATDEPFFIRHFVTNLRFVALEPDRAETTAYFMVLTPAGPDHWGRYRDRWVREGDRWRFAHRLAAVDAGVAGSWWSQART